MEQIIRQIAKEEPRLRKFECAQDVHDVYRDEFIHALIIVLTPDLKVAITCQGNHKRIKDVKRYLENVFNSYIQAVLKADTHTRCIQSLSGIYAISYEDCCSAPGVICFNKKEGDPSVLMPDLYQMTNYNGNIRTLVDNKSFTSKIPIMFFVGATTGSANLAENERINVCVWSLKNRDISKFGVNYIVQRTRSDIQTYLDTLVPSCNVDSIIFTSTSLYEQLNYKYLLSIDGNACAWDRPVWIMKSNSMMIVLKSGFMSPDSKRHVCWYSSLLLPNIHYMEAANMEELRHVYNMCETMQTECQTIIKNAHAFVDNVFLDTKLHFLYTAALFGLCP